MALFMRAVRISVLLALILALGYACIEVAGRYLGDRVYLKNSSACTIHLMSQHNGQKVEPGETVLVKPGFVDRTPSMLVVHAKGIWIGGLHFSADKFSVRGEADREVPAEWVQGTIFGRRLVFDLNPKGQLAVIPPNPEGLSQPRGFPVNFRDAKGVQLCAA